MTIVAIFKNNVSVFMHQLAKFPQDSSRKINEQMPNTITNCEFFNDTTGTGAQINLKNTVDFGGFKKVTGQQRVVDTVTFRMNSEGSGKNVTVYHKDSAGDNISWSDAQAVNTASVQSFDFDLTQNGTPEPFRNGHRIVAFSNGDDTDFVHLKFNTGLSGQTELIKTQGDNGSPTVWTDTNTQSPAAIVSSSGGACP